MKKLLAGFIIFVVFISAGWADQSLQQKIESAIRRYIVDKNPLWESAKLSVLFKLNRKTEKHLVSYGTSASFYVPEIYANSKVTPNMILPLQVLEAGVERERIFVRTTIGLYKNILVAKKSIKKGGVFTKDALLLKNRNILKHKNNYLSILDEVVGKQTRGYVSAGTVITRNMIRTIPKISRNQEVDICVLADGLRVEAKGIALEDGNQNDVIWVRRQNSKEKIRGKISAPGKVEIQL
ncbi:MAG: flagellar basal body P-ring formation protein FlgA [Candidatus Saganbacteria bacterium]|nr:flagellar basal body P-ring formation protein FlgA [Candidatus Saganbacteria bacterium]